jgi:hypothetical protein
MNPQNQEDVWLTDSPGKGTLLTGLSDSTSAYFLIVFWLDYFVNML